MSFISNLEKKFFGNHPRGLPMLFMSEFWERFSFYGMRALLVLYMIKAMKDPRTGVVFTEADAYEVYGAYGAMVYAFPVLGGFLADRLLGYRRAIAMGGILMAIGHFLMAVNHPYVFFLALAFLCVGNGFFKPNISSTVGSLYRPGDKRRDAGFTIFYMGINFGALLAPLVCGTLGETVSWHVGFSLAGIGMVLGLIMFVRGRGRLEGHGEAPDEARLNRRTLLGIPNRVSLWIGVLLLTPLLALLLNFNEFLGVLLNILGICILVVLIITAVRSPTIWRHRLSVLIVLMFFHIMFWAFFEQAGSSLTTLADKHVDRVVASTGMPASDVGRTIEDFSVTQEHWNEEFKDVEITEEHVAGDGMIFSGFPIEQEFVGTTFKDLKVEFDYGDVWFDEREITEDDIGKKFGDLQVTTEEQGERPLRDILQGPEPFASRFQEAEVERKHRGQKLTARGEAPAFDEVVVGPTHVGKEVASARVTEGQLGKTFSTITITPDDSEAGKVLARVTLDESHVGMGIGGAEVKASQFQSINPLFIVLLAPLFSMLWLKLGRLGKEPSTPMKFALAMFQIGLGFYMLKLAGGRHDAGMIAMWWLILSYLFQTTGELCLSPVGLSAVTRLAPPKIVGFAMGAWFLTIAFAHHFAAQIAKLTTAEDTGKIELTHEQKLFQYTDTFGIVALSAAGAGVLLLLLTPFLKRLMHEGVRTPEDEEQEAALHPKEYPPHEEGGVTGP